MSLHLSKQEMDAVKIYNRYTKAGLVDTTPLWVDDFTWPIFRDMPPDGEVVDIGCGTGRAISLLPDLGISKYLGIDPSHEAIRHCKKHHPEYSFEVGDFRTIGKKYPKRFSGFIVITTLMHIPRKDLGDIFYSMRSCLRRGAPGLISFPTGDPGESTFTNKQGMRLTLFTENEVTQALAQQNLRVEYARVLSENYMVLLSVVAT
jgi:SAM-dependent methyltransferase